MERTVLQIEWILDSYTMYEEGICKEIGDSILGRFTNITGTIQYCRMNMLSNEYILRIGKKGYVLDDNLEAKRQLSETCSVRLIMSGNFAENLAASNSRGCPGIKSLREDGNNLKISVKFQSNAQGVSCLNSTLSFLFHFLNVQ
ncbi:hypothetical protein Tco_0948804 [Tanacetum coccineum]